MLPAREEVRVEGLAAQGILFKPPFFKNLQLQTSLDTQKRYKRPY